MIIQCPRCSTRWRVADPAATENPVFKCGRCHNVFQRFPGAAAVSERAGHGRQRAAGPPEPDTLEFIFPRRRPADEARAPDEPPTIAPLRDIVLDARDTAPAPAEPEPTVAREDTLPAEPPVAPTDGLALADASFDDSAPSEAAPSEAALDEAAPDEAGAGHDLSDRDLAPAVDDDAPLLDDDFATSAADDDAPSELGDIDGPDESTTDVVPDRRLGRAPVVAARVLHVEGVMRGASIFGFSAIARVLIVLVGAHALLALLIRANPGSSAEVLGRVPLVGTRLADEPALGRDILLRNVQGGYQRLKNARLVFVISGEAVNNSLATVERIQVEGALYGASGEVDRKVISTGNETTLKLSDLSEPEIALLQRFEPHATLAPGASIPFSIVFLEPPPKLREFSSRVLTARPTARAVSPASPPRGPASVG